MPSQSNGSLRLVLKHEAPATCMSASEEWWSNRGTGDGAMIAYARLWECCQFPSPCYGGCDGGYYVEGCRCLDCRATARSETDLRHSRFCPHVRRTTNQRGTGDDA